MAKSYQLKIVTPQGVLYTGEVVHTLVPAEVGYAGVLADHAAYVTSSAGGKLVLSQKDGTMKTFQVGEGFFEVSKNQATFLTQNASSVN